MDGIDVVLQLLEKDLEFYNGVVEIREPESSDLWSDDKKEGFALGLKYAYDIISSNKELLRAIVEE